MKLLILLSLCYQAATLQTLQTLQTLSIHGRLSRPAQIASWNALPRISHQIDVQPLGMMMIRNSNVEDNTKSDSPAALRSMMFTNLDATQEPQLLCDLLMELGAYSTSITDSNRNTDEEVPIFQEPGQQQQSNVAAVVPAVWGKCNVVAHFAASANLESVADLVRSSIDHLSEVTYQLEDLPDRDWVRHVQQSWHPILVEGIVLRFPWHTQEDVDKLLVNYANGTDQSENRLVQLQLEGGVAFGTGEHPTTQLCLSWIQKILQEEHNTISLMDYGSGSGILGLASCLLSPLVTAVGVDIDIDAVRIANQNAANNGISMMNYLPPLEDTMDSESKSILMKAYQTHDNRLVLPPSLCGPVHDILVANILAAPLVTLVPTLAGLVVTGGLLGLSGIMAPQSSMILESYCKYFDNIQVEQQNGDWILITGTRNQRKVEV